jgi:prolyl-tRNA synthetase
MSSSNINFRITRRAVDHGQWYQDVIRAAGLAAYSDVPGCMIIEPNGCALWNRIRHSLGARIEATGHEDMMFPALIPYSYFKREERHIEGFAPELAMIERLRGKVLEDPLCLRPTSKTVIYRYFAERIRSRADLPVLINQWANVFRVEQRTLPFLRTMEFHWQEGHTAHFTEEEARAEALLMAEEYRRFTQDELAIPCISGRKTPRERFAGAVDTFTIESLMPSGKALQCATSHYLGSEFAGAFGVHCIGARDERMPVHTTSWGMSTRIIGAIIMTHADDLGMVMPPRIAPLQVVILPVGGGAAEQIQTMARAVRDLLAAAGIRVRVDTSGERIGRQHYAWEKRGVPLRLTIGQAEVAAETVTVTRRDTGEKAVLSVAGFAENVVSLLNLQHHSLLARAAGRLAERTRTIETLTDLETGQAEGAGLFAAGWAGGEAEEEMLKERFETTIRCIPDRPSVTLSRCFLTGQPAREQVLIAKAY